MKIAFAVPAYWPAVIGVSMYCQELAEGLVEKGHEVTIYAGIQPGLPEKEQRNGVTIRRFERKYFGHSFYVMPSMAEAIARDKPDVVHSHHYGYYEATAGLAAARNIKVPHVFGPYYHPPVYGFKKKILSKAYHWKFGKPLLKHSSIVLPHTNVEKNFLLHVGGIESTMRILPNTVNTKLFKPNGKKEKLVLFVSNLITEKGAGVALDIAQRVTKERKDVKFIFKGKPYDKNVVEQIEKVGNNKRIEFIYEDMSTEDLARLYAKAAVIVLPSKYEAFSKVLAEAQACGTPVVATKVGGIPEVVLDGHTGYLTGYGDWDEMREKVLELIEDPRLAKKMGMAGREHVERNFSSEIIVNRLEKIYKELV